MTTSTTTLANSSVLITGANRGLGLALVEETLRRGAKRVNAGTRRPYTHPDNRVVPLALDITEPAKIQAAAAQVDSLDLLINNAGVSLPDDLGGVTTEHWGEPVRDWEVTGVPARLASGGTSRGRGGARLVGRHVAYTQSQRALLAADGVRVHAVIAGPIDTDMVRGLEIPKTAPEVVACGLLDGVDRGEEEIFPDPMSATLAAGWSAGDVKALERQNAALVNPQRVGGGGRRHALTHPIAMRSKT